MKKIIGIGNALVDIMTKLGKEELLKELNFPKGSMQLVDTSIMQLITEKTLNDTKQLTTGGSAANTINGLANLGVSTSFIGSIGNDDIGSFFEKDMLRSNINPILFKGAENTGRAIAMISPDAERTFAVYLGAAIELNKESLSIDNLKGHDILYIEGYLIPNRELVLSVAKMAKEIGMKICYDMASFNVVEENREFINEFIEKYIDIVFANEEEAKAFTGLDARMALDVIAGKCEVAIVKVGSKGSLIKANNKITEIGVIECNKLDTTGAGDMYAAGFLYGYINDLSMAKCGYYGSLLSGKVIEVIGAKMDNEKWSEINNIIKK
ncbi:MAG: sugar kinase [Bacteroidetes bacterium GWE2_29_8]|nr:MAG: sugar kinase [Bacteroidetes bacterium GWE2_29_8]